MLMNFVLLIFLFKELKNKNEIHKKMKKGNRRERRESRGNGGKSGESSRGSGRGRGGVCGKEGCEKREIIPMIISMGMFFIIVTVFSVFETICTPITSHYFGWDTKENGLLLLSVGFLSVLTFLFLGFVVKKLKVDDRVLLIFGFLFLFSSMLTVTPYPDESSLKLWQLLLSAFFLSIGYPIASSLSFSLFSKVSNFFIHSFLSFNFIRLLILWDKELKW